MFILHTTLASTPKCTNREGKNEKSGKLTKRKNTGRLESKESNIFEIFDLQKEKTADTSYEEKIKSSKSRSRSPSKSNEGQSSFPMDGGKRC